MTATLAAIPNAVVTLSEATFLVGCRERPISAHSIRRAARRLGVLTEANGVDAIPIMVAREFAERYRESGFLTPRRFRSAKQATG